MKLVCIIILFFSVCTHIFSQNINVTSTQTPQQLVNSVLLGSGVTASNITINGVAGMANTPFGNIGYFTNANGTFPMTSGLILTTGDAIGAVGPNSSGNSTNPGTSQSVSFDPDLNAIANGTITNGVLLEFDFIPAGDTLIFNYLFGSDEYIEFAPPNNSSFNDAFGIFLWGPGVSGPFTFPGYPNGGSNIAVIPGGIPVTINNINPVTNPQYYVFNEFPQDTYGDAIQYDGTTVKLTASASVQCNQTYHIKFAIANVLDQAYDSGVFLEAGSFSSSAVSVAVATVSGDTTIVEGCTYADFIFTRPEAQMGDTLIINYSISGTATQGVDYNNMTNPIIFLPGQDTVILNLTPVQDGLNEGFESVTIMVSIINPCGDTITSQGTIYIGDGPIINIIASDVLVQCFPDSVLLTASAFGGYGPYNFIWTTLTGSPISTVDSFYVTVSQNGVIQYLVTATDQCNFTQTDTATVTVSETISIDNITVVNSSCVPSGSLSVQTSGTNGNVTYSWSTGQTTQSIQNLVSAWYQVTVTDAVCSTIDSAFVDIIAPPLANFSADPVSGCSPLTVQFTDNSQNGTLYNWNFGNGQTASANAASNQNMTYTTAVPESYTATLVVAQGQFCLDTFTIVIQVDVCDCNDPEAMNYNPLANVNVPSNCIYPYPEISVPNVFTPNGDTNNDDFFLTWKNVTSLNLVIINRWGNLVFEEFSDDLINNNPSWDGDSDGKPVSNGIYFYKYTAYGISGQELVGHGFIHLLK
jgi:gliding motility-associated-like protein